MLVALVGGEPRETGPEASPIEGETTPVVTSFGGLPVTQPTIPASYLAEDEDLYDSLTGLPGRLLQRAHLVHALKRATRTGTQVAVLFLDLDDFHDINERLGREIGDQVLLVMGARLEACLRGTDMTARLDGDQFVIVCEDLTDPRDLDRVMRRVRDALAAALHVGDSVVEVRASIGTALSEGADRPGALLTAADRAMRTARRAERATR
jgi:diguanylate cyclase (GGDEF)-like protein